ncbi:MAG: fluoride efflux transporter CrcB [Planctomycetes bacterium]|nr:fluoride efflux transporter CrcB [Planctomycetota bacterium]
MREWLAVACGGAVGSLLRWQVGRLVDRGALPWATLTVNVTGSFLVGALVAFGITAARAPLWQLLLVTGFAGGFTTWSAFNQELLELLRAGQVARALGYAGLTLLASLAGAAAAAALARPAT